ncbi:hydrolase [Acetobacter orientalis]|uniref:Hydrolase n=1 Tax=Acetobacter orientalis TaxID=146474 RepID=A0A2Z5ZHZ2_9PROT|nr:hydrolase [Acetobacter orientalis]
MMPRFLRPSAVATTSAATLPSFTTRLSPALVRALLPFDLVIVPGLFGSGEDHWQSIWLSLFQAHGLSARRVEQQDWAHPTPEAWHTALAHTLATTRKPVLLIAHSLGAILSVQHGLGQTPTTSPPHHPLLALCWLPQQMARTTKGQTRHVLQPLCRPYASLTISCHGCV